MDKKALIKGLRDFGQSASNTVADTVAVPVDMIAAGLRYGGLPIPSDPVGGSQWMRNQGLTAEVPPGMAKTAGEAAGMIVPMVAAAKAPQIAAGMNQMARNAVKPSTLNKQAGMIRIPGRGKIPETRADVNKLADRFGSLLDDAGVVYTHDKSGISPARYFEFDNPATLADEYGPEKFKVRISDHRNVHGADISVDPATGGTFEEMLNDVRKLGIPIANKLKPASKSVIDDATLEKIYGIRIDTMKSRGMDIESIRKRYTWDRKGFWTDKDR